MQSRSRTAAVLLLVACSIALIPFWAFPWVSTQDGPAHAYNAHIILESLKGDSHIAAQHVVHWNALPNWGSYVVLSLLLTVLPTRYIDPAMASITLTGVAFSLLWLRRRVTGSDVPVLVIGTILLLGLNQFWLLGFHSFLIGIPVAIFGIGLYWSWRDSLTVPRAICLAVVQVVAYFCHAVPWGFLVAAMFMHGALAPGPRRFERVAKTIACLMPSAVLGMVYWTYARAFGSAAGVGDAIQYHSLAPVDIANAIDFVTLKSKTALPFVESRSIWFACVAPFVTVLTALVLLSVERVSNRQMSESRSWAALALLLLGVAIVGPSGLGAHGGYLPARAAFFAAVAATPIFVKPRGILVKFAAVIALVTAVTIQYASVWEYALSSSRRVTQLLSLSPYIGEHQRIVGITLDRVSQFQANPMTHAYDLLGIASDNMVWTNYEAGQYEFPVKFLKETPYPSLSMRWSEATPDNFRRFWRDMIRSRHDEIDIIVMSGEDAKLEGVTEVEYERAALPAAPTAIQVFRRRDIGPRIPAPTEALTR